MVVKSKLFELVKRIHACVQKLSLHLAVLEAWRNLDPSRNLGENWLFTLNWDLSQIFILRATLKVRLYTSTAELENVNTLTDAGQVYCVHSPFAVRSRRPRLVFAGRV